MIDMTSPRASATAALLSSQLPHAAFKVEEPLARYTYCKIGGPAEIFVEPKTRDELVEIVLFCQKNALKYTLLGGASNVIVSSKGLRGVVIRPTFDEYVCERANVGTHHLVRIGAGAKTALFVRKTIDDGLKGLEYFLGVPGTVGGAIYNNAHYLSSLIGEHVTRVEALFPDGAIRWLSQAECQFSYDLSVFHTNHAVILQAEFSLEEGDKDASLELVKSATLYRAKTQPLGEPSSGCYFRNTPNTPELKQLFPQYAERNEFPTAFLIDQAGLKGQQVGRMKVSQKHGAFFINTGGATSDDVRELAKLVKARIRERYGVELREEVFFLGE